MKDAESTTNSFEIKLSTVNAVLVTAFACGLFILYAYNFVRFMILKKRYRQFLQVVFYTVALLSIAINVILAWIPY